MLEPDAADLHVWPSRQPHVVLRGFLIDVRYQGQGIGTAATGEAVTLAQRTFPKATAVVLTVHVDNLAGQQAYERAGFTYTGRQVTGRAGQEYVMSIRLAAAEPATP